MKLAATADRRGTDRGNIILFVWAVIIITAKLERTPDTDNLDTVTLHTPDWCNCVEGSDCPYSLLKLAFRK